MDPLTGAALISGGASLIGGLMGKRSQEKANKQNIDALKYGLGWKIQDAKKHGIHPLAAIGAPVSSGNAVSVGDSGVSQAGRSMASIMGQKMPAAQVDNIASQTRLNNARASEIEKNLSVSTAARIEQNNNIQQDLPEPAGHTQAPKGRQDLEARTQKHGEIVGELLNIVDTPKRAYRGARNARNKHRAGYVYDENTGRVYRNPYKKTGRRITRRGYRR